MNWDVIETFLAVLKAERVSRAARELGVSVGTVRRRIQGLEAISGCPLFIADGPALSPTATGLKLGEVARRMAMEFCSVSPRAQRPVDQIGGEVRITGGELVALSLLPPVYLALKTRLPNLVLKLGVTNRAEDLLRGEADIAVRLFRPTQRALVARSAGHARLGLFAHRRYIEAAGAPANLEDLQRFDMIGSGEDTPTMRALRDAGVTWPQRKFSILMDSSMGQVIAMREGLGIGVDLTALAERDENLVRVLPDIGVDVSFWISMHEDLREVPRMRRVFDALVQFFESWPTLALSP